MHQTIIRSVLRFKLFSVLVSIYETGLYSEAVSIQRNTVLGCTYTYKVLQNNITLNYHYGVWLHVNIMSDEIF